MYVAHTKMQTVVKDDLCTLSDAQNICKHIITFVKRKTKLFNRNKTSYRMSFLALAPSLFPIPPFMFQSITIKSHQY